VTVKRILQSRPEAERAYIAPGKTVRDALRILADRNVGALVVSSDGDTIEGILSERDIVRGLNSEGEKLLDSPVDGLMTKKVITCVTTDSASGIMAVMANRGLRHVPVVEDGKFVSMVSVRDLMAARLNEVQSDAKAMHDYISGIGEGPV